MKNALIILSVILITSCSNPSPESSSSDGNNQEKTKKENKMKGIKSTKDIFYTVTGTIDKFKKGYPTKGHSLTEYDRDGNTIRITPIDPKGNITGITMHHEYDQEGNIIKAYSQDEKSNFKKIIEYNNGKRGKSISYFSFSHNGYTTNDTTIEYCEHNEKGDLVLDKRSDHAVRYEYDQKGIRTSEAVYDKDDNLKYFLKLTDFDGTLVKAYEAYLPDSTLSYKCTQKFDQTGEAIETHTDYVSDKAQDIHTKSLLRYDFRGNWTQATTFTNGQGSSMTIRTIEYWDRINVDKELKGSIWETENGDVRLEFSSNSDKAFMFIKDKTLNFNYSQLSDRVVLDAQENLQGLAILYAFKSTSITVMYQNENTLFLSGKKRDLVLHRK